MLTQDQINQIVARNGGTWTDPQTGRVYMANHKYGGSSENGDWQYGMANPVENIVGSVDGKFGVGNMITNVDPVTGKETDPFKHEGVNGDLMKAIAPIALAAGAGWLASGGLSNLPFDVGGGGADAAPLGAGGGYDVPATFNAAKDSQLAYGLPEAMAPGATGVNSAFSGGVSGLPAASGGGWMSTLANAVGGADNLKLLGSLGTGLLAAGSPAPQSTRESKMDPRLDPYVYGDKGVIPMASLLYQNRTNPTSQTMQDRAALRARAKGLLGI